MDYNYIIWIIPIILSAIALYYSSFKGADISLITQEPEIPELNKNKFLKSKSVYNVPNILYANATLVFHNKGNRAGVVKDLKNNFKPTNEFQKFFKRVEWNIDPSFKSLTIRDKDAKPIEIEWRFCINPVMKPDYEIDLENIDIKSDNLQNLLDKLWNHKREILGKFIQFLKSNKKLGDIEITYDKIGKNKLFEAIIKKGKGVIMRKKFHNNLTEINHFYKKTIAYYEESYDNYKLYPDSKEIIERVIRELKHLKKGLSLCLKDYEEYKKNDIWFFRAGRDLITEYLKEKNHKIELLSKCQKYRWFIIEHLKPLIEDIDKYRKIIDDINKTPIESIKQKLKEELKMHKTNLKPKIEEGREKLEELIEEIEKESP